VVKRAFDLVFALVALVLLLPAELLIALAVWAAYGPPVLFTSLRVGRNQVPFKAYKFRTMTNDRNEDGEFLPDEERLRPFGRLLRRTSLDELPQLLNVVRGQMSIVGPRALPTGHLAAMPREYARRFDVMPGLTGLTQALFRGGNRTWEEKYRLDLQYVDTRSLWQDARIILLTFVALARRFKFNKRGGSLGAGGADE
jgi:sugar transferase EpsL